MTKSMPQPLACHSTETPIKKNPVRGTWISQFQLLWLCVEHCNKTRSVGVRGWVHDGPAVHQIRKLIRIQPMDAPAGEIHEGRVVFNTFNSVNKRSLGGGGMQSSSQRKQGDYARVKQREEQSDQLILTTFFSRYFKRMSILLMVQGVLVLFTFARLLPGWLSSTTAV